MYYTIYKTTNKINGKSYIGKHVTNNINDDYLGSGLLLNKAIKKYGRSCFEKKILYVYDNKHDMNSKEKELINENVVTSADYYNIALGGQGGNIVFYDDNPDLPKIKQNLKKGQAKIRNLKSENAKKYHRQKKIGMYGKQQSDNQKNAVSKAQTGRLRTEKEIEKQKESLANTFSDPNYIHPNTGLVRSEETKRKISNAVRNRKEYTCEHCGLILKGKTNYIRYHGNRCKKR